MPVPDGPTPDAPIPDRAATGRPRLGIAAWCLYDWANSAFNTIIGTFVFSVYFAAAIVGDAQAGSALWGYAMAAIGLAVALASPVAGAVADRGGRIKPWLGLLVATTVLATAALWWARPDPAFVVLALVLVGIATIAFELSGLFYNALLPVVAPPALIGRVSGWGWGLGYAGGLAALAVSLFVFLNPEPWVPLDQDSGLPVRATVLVVAVWFALFALPLFLVAPDRPARPAGGGGGRPVRDGLAALIGTIRTLPRHPPLLRFLIASALYRDGLTTLFAVGGLYAAGTFAMEMSEILIFAIGLNVTAGLGAAAFAWVDDGLGPKRTILIALCGLAAAGLPLLLIGDIGWFLGLALVLGIFVGPAQAASRSLMVRLCPDGRESEYFGLYQFTGKAAAVTGPLMFAVLTDAFDSQRAGMASILALWVAGAVVLLTVREPPRRDR